MSTIDNEMRHDGANPDPVEQLLNTLPAAFACDSGGGRGVATVRVEFAALADAQRFHGALVAMFNHQR